MLKTDIFYPSKFWVIVLSILFILTGLPAYCIAGVSPPKSVEQRAVQLVRSLAAQKKDSMDWQIAGLLEKDRDVFTQSLDRPLIPVVLYLKSHDDASLIDRLKSLGVKIETHQGRRIQVRVNRALLETISKWDGIDYISRAINVTPSEIVSEAVHGIGADILHDKGITGNGVKIGIIDVGFFGYSILLGSELPKRIVKKSFRHDVCGFSSCPSQAHGTAVAEIIHDIAPDAKLYLVAIETMEEFLDAVEWLEEQDIDIVSCSLSYWFCGPLDGTGWCSQKTGHLRLKGILPVFAAGNNARNHWAGLNKDENGDKLVEIDGDLQAIYFSSYTNEEVIVSANWDDWGNDPENAKADQDIDLLVLSPIPYSVEVETVAISFNTQAGKPGNLPIEYASFDAEPGRDYYVFIVNSNTTRDVKVHVYITSSSDIFPYVEKQSILQPGDSPLVLTVAASDLSGHVFDYSGRGPTWNGKMKPDIAGISDLTTSSISNFSGTSAAVPTVAGAAALLKEAYPDWGPDQLQAALELLAKDIYKPGQDNVSGCGLVDISRVATLAKDPVTGFWWNPQKDGTGFSIAREEGTDFLAVYTYKAQGDSSVSVPVWLTAGGGAFSSITGPWPLLLWNGWPLGTTPGDYSYQKAAEISIIYLSEKEGILQVRDPVTNKIYRQNIERFYFANNSNLHEGDLAGWWWDHSLPGNGIFIDIQSGTLFSAWYHYDENGSPRWWTFSGNIPTGATQSLKADIIEWNGGPCLTCLQVKPQGTPVGSVELTFSNGVPSTLAWYTFTGESGTYNLTRFPFWE